METSTSSRDVRTWNVLCHATALAGFFVPWAGHILGPLIIWLAKRSDSPEIDDLHILNLVLVIVASIQASEGKFYRYPLTIRLIK